MDLATPWTAARQASLSITNPHELAQTYVLRVGDVIQPSNPLSSPSPPTFNLSQHQEKRVPEDAVTDSMNLGLRKFREAVKDKGSLAGCSPWGRRGRHR